MKRLSALSVAVALSVSSVAFAAPKATGEASAPAKTTTKKHKKTTKTAPKSSEQGTIK